MPAARDFPDSVEELRSQLALERALADVFESLASVPVTHVAEAIERTLNLIGERLDFDIVSIWLPVGAMLDFRLAYLHRRDATGALPGDMLARERFPWTMREIIWDRTVAVPDTRSPPPGAGIDAASWKAFGIRSSLTFPLTDGGRLLGSLTFDTVRRSDTWAPYLVQRLQLVARAFANALGRREMYETLREGEERFRSVSEATLAGVYIVVDGRVTYANAALVAMFGYPLEEVIGADPTAICHPEDRARVAEALRQGLSGESHSVRYECRAVCKGGEVRSIEVLGSRAMLQGRPALIGNIIDMTERRLAEDARAKATADLRESLVATIEAMASTVELRDLYTAGHQKRVARLAAAIAVEMGLPAEAVEGIRFGALIHDLGNIQIPTEVLVRPGPLSPTEFRMVKAHPRMGYDIVKDIRFPWPVATAILQHHERLDGSGYPDGLKGDAISIEARIVAIADVVEAMSSHRPYRPSLGIDAALAEIETGRGTRFDARAVDACLRLFREKRFAF